MEGQGWRKITGEREEMGEKPSLILGAAEGLYLGHLCPPPFLSFNLVSRSQLSSAPLPSSARGTLLSPADLISCPPWR